MAALSRISFRRQALRFYDGDGFFGQFNLDHMSKQNLGDEWRYRNDSAWQLSKNKKTESVASSRDQRLEHGAFKLKQLLHAMPFLSHTQGD